MGLCDKAPACEVGHKHVNFSNLQKIKNVISKQDFHPEIIEGINLKNYIDSGGYEILKKCYANKIDVDHVINQLNESGLKGMGGGRISVWPKMEVCKNGTRTQTNDHKW